MKFNQAFFGVHMIEFSADYVQVILHICHEQHILLFRMKSVGKDRWQAGILIKDWAKFTQIMEKENIDILYRKRTGIWFFFMRGMERKEWFIALVLSFICLFGLQHTVIEVEYEPMPSFMQTHIEKELQQIGLKKWAWIPALQHPSQMEVHLIQHVPNIQHVQIKRMGNKYVINVEEKDEIVKEQSKQQPQHLIASKSGVIESYHIKQGEVVVERRTTVQKGDLLVSGVIENENNEEKKQFVHAEGSVYANTWYEMNVSMPLVQHKERLTGPYVSQFRLYLKDWHLPIWGQLFHAYDENNEVNMTMNKWRIHQNIPIVLKQHHYYETNYIETTLSKEQLEANMITYITEQLKKNLGKHVKIKKYYILHEQLGNGKVKWNLYISVIEDIAQPKQIKSKR